MSERVIAIQKSDEKNVYIYGYGEYVGEEPCPKLFNIKNPKIILDNGNVIWGCECWWGNADRVEKEIIKNRKVIVVGSDKE